MKKTQRHTLIEDLAREEREEIWNAYRAKYPNHKWSLIYFALWFVWISIWMLLSLWIDLYYLEDTLSLVLHFTCLLMVGIIGGAMLVSRVMLPIRVKNFHAYLDSMSMDALKLDLGLSIN